MTKSHQAEIDQLVLSKDVSCSPSNPEKGNLGKEVASAEGQTPKASHCFEFHQNNSGGSFDIDDQKGIGPRVWIEALDAAHANSRAEALGIYFDGVGGGMDCECCGDRWYPAWSAGGKAAPDIDERYDFNWHDTVYVHRLDGSIERISKAESQS